MSLEFSFADAFAFVRDQRQAYWRALFAEIRSKPFQFAKDDTLQEVVKVVTDDAPEVEKEVCTLLPLLERHPPTFEFQVNDSVIPSPPLVEESPQSHDHQSQDTTWQEEEEEEEYQQQQQQQHQFTGLHPLHHPIPSFIPRRGWNRAAPEDAHPPWITIRWEGCGKVFCPALSSGTHNTQRELNVNESIARTLAEYNKRREKVDNRWVKRMEAIRRRLSSSPSPLLLPSPSSAAAESSDIIDFDDPYYKSQVNQIWIPTIGTLLTIWYRNRHFEPGRQLSVILGTYGIHFLVNCDWDDVVATCATCGNPIPILYTSAPGQPWKTTFQFCMDHLQRPCSPLQRPPMYAWTSEGVRWE